MFIASFRIPINAGEWFIQPLTRYVMSDSMYNKIMQQLAESYDKAGKTHDFGNGWSSFNSYERRYGGQDLNGRRLAIYRESGFGDNMIVSGLCRYLKHTYPSCQIDVFGLPHVQTAWNGNRDVTMMPVCPTFDALRNYDYHVLLEGMIENDNEPDQRNAYDNLFDFCGIYSRQVPDEFKRPNLQWSESDKAARDEWSSKKPWKYILWHWNPSGLTRMYPVELAVQAIEALAHHCEVVVIGHTENGKFESPELTSPEVHNYVGKTPKWRDTLPMVSEAKLVIAPDSSILHAAAGLNVPCIGLWGSFHPDDRAKYYPHHHAMQAFNVCPKAPCHVGKDDLPRHWCQQAQGYDETQPWCTAMKAIDPQRIVEKALKLI